MVIKRKRTCVTCTGCLVVFSCQEVSKVNSLIQLKTWFLLFLIVLRFAVGNVLTQKQMVCCWKRTYSKADGLLSLPIVCFMCRSSKERSERSQSSPFHSAADGEAAMDLPSREIVSGLPTEDAEYKIIPSAIGDYVNYMG